MNEHDMDQPEEIDPPSWALGASEHAGTEFVESMPGAQGNRPANVEAAPSPRHPKNAKETQGETRPESDRQLDLESMRGLASTLRASKSNSDHREICTERADQITPRKLRWLWPERIPLGKVTVFAGLPGQGKSLATVDIAARLTRGAEYPDVANPMPPSEVWLVAGEDDPEDVLVRDCWLLMSTCPRSTFRTAFALTDRMTPCASMSTRRGSTDTSRIVLTSGLLSLTQSRTTWVMLR